MERALANGDQESFAAFLGDWRGVPFQRYRLHQAGTTPVPCRRCIRSSAAGKEQAAPCAEWMSSNCDAIYPEIMAIEQKKKRLSSSDRKDKIIDAAVGLFARKGYEATSIDEVATKAGITKPVVYDHFESKAQLFIAILELVRDDLLRRGAAVVIRTPNREERLRGTIGAFLDFVQEQPERARVLIIGSKGAPSITEACRDVQAQATLGIAQLIRSQRVRFRSSAKQDRLVLLTAEFVKKGMHGLAEWWLDHPGIPRKEVESALIEILMRGLSSRTRVEVS